MTRVVTEAVSESGQESVDVRSDSSALESVPGKLNSAGALKGTSTAGVSRFREPGSQGQSGRTRGARKRRFAEADMLNLVSASNLPTPIFLGYCATDIWVPTEEWCRTWGAHIPEIASVSDCLSGRAPNWIDRWDFNRSTCWNDESLSLAAVPAERLPHFRLFCYRLLPILFGASGEPKSVSLDEVFTDGLLGLPDEPNLSNYRSLGYDIVEAPLTPSVLGFGCSPLSCNGMAEEIAVNRYCLVDDLDNAFAIAKRFGVERPEPGPYVIVEVLRRS